MSAAEVRVALPPRNGYAHELYSHPRIYASQNGYVTTLSTSFLHFLLYYPFLLTIIMTMRYNRPAGRSVVEAFVDKQLSKDSHPAFVAVREESELRLTRQRVDQIPEPSDQTALTSVAETRTERSELQLYECGPEIEGAIDKKSLSAIYRKPEEEAREFQKIFQELELDQQALPDKKKSKHHKNGISSSASSWSDVLAELDKVADGYNNPTGAWGRVRRGFRKFEEKAPAMKTWLDAFPKDSVGYFSILVGGLKLIVTV